ncbi:hypothetical protein D9M71_320030 [compost metagenome]
MESLPAFLSLSAMYCIPVGKFSSILSASLMRWLSVPFSPGDVTPSRLPVDQLNVLVGSPVDSKIPLGKL